MLTILISKLKHADINLVLVRLYNSLTSLSVHSELVRIYTILNLHQPKHFPENIVVCLIV
jgi:hypothetical protein